MYSNVIFVFFGVFKAYNLYGSCLPKIVSLISVRRFLISELGLVRLSRFVKSGQHGLPGTETLSSVWRQFGIYYSNISFTVPAFHLLFQLSIYYSHILFNIPAFNLLFKHSIYYSTNPFTTPTLHLLFQHFMYYSHIPLTIPTFYLIFQHSIYYSNNPFTISAFHLLFPHSI